MNSRKNFQVWIRLEKNRFRILTFSWKTILDLDPDNGGQKLTGTVKPYLLSCEFFVDVFKWLRYLFCCPPTYAPYELYDCGYVLQDATVDDIRVRRPLPKLLRYGSPPEIRYFFCYCFVLVFYFEVKHWLIDWSVYNVRELFVWSVNKKGGKGYLTKQFIYWKFIDRYFD